MQVYVVKAVFALDSSDISLTLYVTDSNKEDVVASCKQLKDFIDLNRHKSNDLFVQDIKSVFPELENIDLEILVCLKSYKVSLIEYLEVPFITSVRLHG